MEGPGKSDPAGIKVGATHPTVRAAPYVRYES